MDRWAEYNAGTLTPPVVVQHDTLYVGTPNEEHLIWVWTGARIQGPFSRSTYDASVESVLLILAPTLDPLPPDTFEILAEDGETIEGTL